MVEPVILKLEKSPHAKLTCVPINSVRLNDVFWSPKMEVLRKRGIPHQYEMLEKVGSIENFRKASQGRKAREGFLFTDSDLYKWVEAVGFALAYKPDKKLADLVKRVVNDIISAQEEDGYLNTYTALTNYIRWSNLKDAHELYCAGHLIQASISLYRAGIDTSLFKAAEKFSRNIYEYFVESKNLGVPGHPEIEMALVELYRETGIRIYLETSQFFLDNRGKGLIGGGAYYIDHIPFRKLSKITGHAVRSLYLNCGATDIYMETGDKSLLKALNRLWNNLVTRKMYVTGGVGSRYAGESIGDDYELPNRTAYSETCAAIANVMWNWRMFLATSKSIFLDVMEAALYNNVLAGVSKDGKHYFYVNPLSDYNGSHRRREWYACACCPPNILRMILSLPGYLYAVSEDGIYFTLYVSNTAEISFKGGLISICEETKYPWDGNIEITVSPQGISHFSIYLRIPAWSEKAKIYLNGKSVKSGGVGFIKLTRSWREGDKITLKLDTSPRLLVSHPHVESNYCKVCIVSGPIVYCVEKADNPKLDIFSMALPKSPKLKEEYEHKLLGGLKIIKGECYEEDTGDWSSHLYRELKKCKTRYEKKSFVAIPYYAWANRRKGPMAIWLKLRK